MKGTNCGLMLIFVDKSSWVLAIMPFANPDSFRCPTRLDFADESLRRSGPAPRIGKG